MDFSVFIQKLKNIIGIELGDILSKNKIGSGSLIRIGGKDTHIHLEGNKTIVIPESKLKELPDEKKKELTSLLREDIQGDNPLLDVDSSNKTEILRENIPTSEDKTLLQFYEGKLSTEYLKALEAALIVRNMFKHNIDISFAKADIHKKYPLFGRNLCNLVSEGYFDNHFKELYESMKEEEDFKDKRYREHVEKIVVSLPYTVFVGLKDNYPDKISEINKKLELLKKYGTPKLLVHAIGNRNVKKTEEILNKIKEQHKVTLEEEKTKNRITALLKF